MQMKILNIIPAKVIKKVAGEGEGGGGLSNIFFLIRAFFIAQSRKSSSRNVTELK